MTNSTVRLQSRHLALLAALLAITLSWFILLGYRALFNPDEGRYAEIPREMLVSGNWLVPRLNDLIYIEKPPLQYWATAVSYALFGPSEWSARLYTGLCGFLTVLISAGLAWRLWGPTTAWRAGIMSASSLLIVLMAHQLTLDMSLTFFTTLMLAAFCIAHDSRTVDSRRRHWMWLAWAAAAGAFLTKGLVALILPALTLLAYSIVQRQWSIWRQLSIARGLTLFLLLVLPWMLLMQRAVPQFFDFFIVREHFARYLTMVSNRYEPWWFFLAILVGGSLPWTIPTVRALLTGWRRSTTEERFDVRRFLWIWSVSVLVFFSASDSKLVPYILPMFPSVALLMATIEETQLRRDLRQTSVLLLVIGTTFLALAVLLPRLVPASPRGELFFDLRPVLFVDAVIALIGGVLATRDGGSLRLAAIVGATGYLCAAALLWGARAVETVYSGESLATQLPPALYQNVPMFSVRTYDQSLPFYLRRTLTLVDEKGELAFGVQFEPHKGIPSLENFESQWQDLPQALAVVEPKTYALLQQHGVPMVVRARDLRRLIVSRQ
jgi:4-amino-4-deoxy-L-arabinose transferase-like glycosyltransferase